MRWIVVAGMLVASSSALAQSAPSERQRQAAAALLAGKLADAEMLYQQALAEPSPDAPVWFDLCLVRYAAGDYGGAVNACYRALPAGEDRVLTLLREVTNAMTAAGLAPGRAVVPEPAQGWFWPEGWLPKVVAVAEPSAEAGAVRTTAPLPSRGVGVDDVLSAEGLELLHGTPPKLPYRERTRPDDYRGGVDAAPQLGFLFYAPDASRFQSGGRVEVIERAPDWVSHKFYFGEYMHAPDSTGGMIAGGVGGAFDGFKASIGGAIPWGRSEGRDGTFQNHVTGLHLQLRAGVHKQLMLGRSWAISFDASIFGGFDFPQLILLLGHGIKNICTEDDEADCPDTPDPYPGWPLGHWGLQAGISLGPRYGHPPYPRAHVFAPMGGP